MPAGLAPVPAGAATVMLGPVPASRRERPDGRRRDTGRERVVVHGTPARDQELLLKAALVEGPEAVTAWNQWSAGADPDRLDEDSCRLLPLVYDAMRRRDVFGPWMEQTQRAYYHTWADNTRRFHAAAAVLRALHGAGIKTMLLKGPALTLQYYRNAGLRPMDDFDILVPT